MINLFFDNLDDLSWDDLPWQDIQIHVFKLQTQIYKMACNHEETKVKKLQDILLKDYSACLLSMYTVMNYGFVKKKSTRQIFQFHILKFNCLKLVERDL